jgi:hypothetical protein
METRTERLERPEDPDSLTRDERVSIEPHWPIALALGSFIVITIVLRVLEPKRESLGPAWLVPAVEIALLVTLLAADPPTCPTAGTGSARSRWRWSPASPEISPPGWRSSLWRCSR